MSQVQLPAPSATRITSQESLVRGVFISSVIALVIGFIFWWYTAWISDYIGILVAAVVGLYVFFGILEEGYDPNNEVPFAHEGVATTVGDNPTGERLAPGVHFRFPGLEGSIPVDQRLRRLDVAVFRNLAADNLPVETDGFVYVYTQDTAKSLTVQNADEDIEEQFEAQCRLWVNQMEKANFATGLRDDLAEYLALSDEPSAINAFRDKLIRESGNKFVEGGIDAIMEEAGDLHAIAAEWGIVVYKVRVENFDLAAEFKQAALEEAKQDALMNAAKKKNAARSEMVAGLRSQGIDPNNALNSVDMTLGMPVKKDVQEIKFGLQNFDPNAFVDTVLKPIADATARRINPQQ